MSDSSEKCQCDSGGNSDLGILLLIGVLTMVFTSSWQMFAAAAGLCVGTLAVGTYRELRR